MRHYLVTSIKLSHLYISNEACCNNNKGKSEGAIPSSAHQKYLRVVVIAYIYNT